jgi:hypothetical protein
MGFEGESPGRVEREGARTIATATGFFERTNVATTVADGVDEHILEHPARDKLAAPRNGAASARRHRHRFAALGHPAPPFMAATNGGFPCAHPIASVMGSGAR